MRVASRRLKAHADADADADAEGAAAAERERDHQPLQGGTHLIKLYGFKL